MTQPRSESLFTPTGTLCRKSRSTPSSVDQPSCKSLGRGGDQIGVPPSLEIGEGSACLPTSPLPPPPCPLAVHALDLEVSSLLSKGAIERVLDPSSPGFYGRIFVVPKRQGGWRPVLDLSSLNRFLTNSSFRLESPTSVRDSIHPNDWATSIDLTDAYYHIHIHKADRKFLRFVWRGQVFQYICLPFGLAPAPWLFTKLTRELFAHVRSAAIRLLAFLDDWLILASSQSLCRSHTTFMLNLCTDLGFLLNQKKSDLEPKQQFQYLGMYFDTVTWKVSPSPDRISRLQTSLAKLESLDQAPARQIAALLGSMESLAPLLPLGRLHKRLCQRTFRSLWSQSEQSWDHLVPLGLQFSLAVRQWKNQTWLSSGVPITNPPPDLQLYTDASCKGWGAHMGSLSTSGSWEPSFISAHINLLELEAACRALKAFLPAVKRKHVLLNSDNTTVCCYINKQGGARSSTLSRRTESLLLWCQDHNILLSAKYVPGHLNVLADALSRSHMILPSEWTLAHSVLQPVWQTWHRPHVDLFATRFSRRLPIFVSPVPDPEALAVDALSMPWRGTLAYAFPPLALLGKVVKKAEKKKPPSF